MIFSCSKEDELNFKKNIQRTFLEDGTENCWLWKGHINTVGYGEFENTSNTKYAHRFSIQYFGKSIPEKYTVNHKCNIRCCVNPKHLNIMTQKRNSKIKYIKQKLDDTDYLELIKPLTPIQECVRRLESEFSDIAYTKYGCDFIISNILLEMIEIRCKYNESKFDIELRSEELIDGYKRKYFWVLDQLLEQQCFSYEQIRGYYATTIPA